MEKQELALMLEQQLRAVQAERQGGQADAALLAARGALKRYQSARLAGLGNLQRFLEQGFDSFKQVRQPQAFIAAIVRRERAALEHLYAGRADPFDITA